MTAHSTEEARLRARIAAHARRLLVERNYRSMQDFSEQLGIGLPQVWRVLTGKGTPGMNFVVAMREGLGADLNRVLTEDPPRRWFRPLKRRPIISWE